MAETKITVVARIKAKPGMENEVKDFLAELLAPTRAEKGCLQYDLHESQEEKGIFLFYENWASRDALDRHLQSQHITAAFDRAPALLAEPVRMTLWNKV